MLKPLGNRVVVRMRNRQEKSSGGIHIPERAQETEVWGEVKAVGPKVAHLKEEDLVYVTGLQGTHFVEGGVDYVLVDEPKILAKLEE